MAFRPSLQKPYHLCSSLDPALDLPRIPALADDASPEDVKHRDALVAERDTKYQNACDSGNWSAYCKPGETPTLFKCRNIHGPTMIWLQGEIRRKQMIETELAEMAFRLGVFDCDIKGITLDFEVVDGHRRITEDSMQEFYSIGRNEGDVALGPAVVFEIGSQIWARALQGVPPKS